MKRVTVNHYPLSFLDYAKALALANKGMSAYEIKDNEIIITTTRSS